jgi:integrase
MPKELITQNLADSAICEAGKSKTDYYDTKINGFVLKVLKSGKRNFYLVYKNNRGIKCEKRLSNMDASVIKVAEARQLAQQYLYAIAMGNDPFTDQADHKQVPILSAFIADSYMPFIKGYKQSWKTDESLIRNHINPAFGDKYMDEITKRDIIGFIAKHRTDHADASVNRIIILMRYIFNLALRWDTKGVKANPTAGIPLLEENNKKERYLSEVEAQALFQAVHQSESKMLQYIIPMLILTGTRKREVLDAKWSEFDFERRLWRIGMTKSGKARHVPISDGVMTLLQSVPRIEGCEYVFANPDTGKPYSSLFSSWDNARKKAGLGDVRIHDLRHSFASFLVNSGRSLYEVQKLLGHTQIKTTQRYAHLANDTLLSASNIVSSLVPIAACMPVNVLAVPMISINTH